MVEAAVARRRGPGGQPARDRRRRPVLHGRHPGRPLRRGPDPGAVRDPRQRRGRRPAHLGARATRSGTWPPIVVVDRPGLAAAPRRCRAGAGSASRCPGLEVSSTDLRARVEDGRPLDYLVPDEVVDCIEERGLYGRRRTEGAVTPDRAVTSTRPASGRSPPPGPPTPSRPATCVVLEVAEVLALCGWFVIASAAQRPPGQGRLRRGRAPDPRRPAAPSPSASRASTAASGCSWTTATSSSTSSSRTSASSTTSSACGPTSPASTGRTTPRSAGVSGAVALRPSPRGAARSPRRRRRRRRPGRRRPRARCRRRGRSCASPRSSTDTRTPAASGTSLSARPTTAARLLELELDHVGVHVVEAHDGGGGRHGDRRPARAGGPRARSWCPARPRTRARRRTRGRTRAARPGSRR